MIGLGTGSPDLVHGTMRVLTEFCQEVTDTQIPHVTPVILPQLLRVIGSPQVSLMFYLIVFVSCIVCTLEAELLIFFEHFPNSSTQCLIICK